MKTFLALFGAIIGLTHNARRNLDSLAYLTYEQVQTGKLLDMDSESIRMDAGAAP